MRLLAAILAILIFVAGCAADSQASKQAGQGAAMEAVGGASGAAVGAVSGSAADNSAKERAAKPPAPDPRNAELRKRIGDKNWASALLIQGIAAEESGDKARADALEGVIKVQAARREHGLPPTCK